MIKWNLRSLWFWSLRFRQLRVPCQKFRSCLDFELTREPRSAPAHLGTSVWQLAHLSIIILLGWKLCSCVDFSLTVNRGQLRLTWGAVCVTAGAPQYYYSFGWRLWGRRPDHRTEDEAFERVRRQRPWHASSLTAMTGSTRHSPGDDSVNVDCFNERERLRTDRPSLRLWWNNSSIYEHKYPDWMRVYVTSFTNK